MSLLNPPKEGCPESNLTYPSQKSLSFTPPCMYENMNACVVVSFGGVSSHFLLKFSDINERIPPYHNMLV